MNTRASKVFTVLALLAVLTLSISPVHGAPAASSQTHVVRWGENLASIAARYGCTVDAIVQVNGLPNPDYIYVGQVLTIPVGGTSTTQPPAGGTYVVQWGESLSTIATRFGCTVDALMTANGITNPNFIYAGQVLTIPSGGQPVPPSSQPPAQQPPKGYYTVQWGDTLESIAYRYGTTVDALMRANNLTNAWYIYVGQLLVIPSGIAVPNYPAGTYYTVKAGDTLNRIAMMYGVSVWAIVQANNLANPSLIHCGQVLVIPGQVTQPPANPVQPPIVPTPYYPYATPVPPSPWPWYPTPVPPGGQPIVTQQYQGRVTSSDCTNQDTWEFRSVLRISVIGKKGLSVKVASDGFSTTGLTGTKPEYGEYAVEFAPFNQGTYTITPDGLGTSLQVRLDGKCTAYVEFTPVTLSSAQ